MLCSPNTDWFSPPPPLPHPPLFPLFSLFSPLCRGPKPAKHISKWQLLRLSSKKPRLVDFPRLMWHLWLRNRVEGERWGPMAQWWFVWGGGGRQGRGQESECERTLAVSRLIQDHWFPASFFLPPGHDLHCKWQFCRIGLFSGVRKDCGGRWGWADGGDRGFPQHTGLLDSITSHPSLKKKKKKTLRCTPPPRVLALVPGSHHSCLSSLPGLLFTTEESTTGSLFCREEAWTTLLLLGVLSPLTSPIRSKKGSARTECGKLALCL